MADSPYIRHYNGSSITLLRHRHLKTILRLQYPTFPSHPFFDFFYDYGEMPGLFAGIIAAIFYLISFVIPSWKSIRKPALVLTLTLGIGAGLIANGILKEYWARPRPRQIMEFGGLYPFTPFYKPFLLDHAEKLKSFPCGHCIMGFYFITFALIAYRHRLQGLFIFSLIVTIVLGGILSLARLYQGGHFFSDIILAACLMWWTALTMDWLIEGEIKS